jgi:hypothetical protein
MVTYFDMFKTHYTKAIAVDSVEANRILLQAINDMAEVYGFDEIKRKEW